MTPSDQSDRLSRLQATIVMLRDLMPDGDWSSHSLFKKWQKRPYSLTTKEFNALEKFLENQRHQAIQQMYAKNYRQFDLFGGADE
jgi:hypothetical protein